MASRDGRFEDEGWRLRKDGSRLWANVVITALRDESGKLLGFSKVTRDMTVRKRVETLEQAERRMTEFLAMLSHELRNPLAAVRNAISMMQIKEIEDPDLTWARDILDRQVTHITRLVDDLLEVSRVTSGSIRLQKQQVDMGTVIARAVEASRPLIDARGHRLELRVPERPMFVEGDMVRLTQVFMNLLNNAAKYTPEGGSIRLTADEDEGVLVVRVRDTGVGIPEDLLPRVFELFAQGERTLDRSDGGLGIGLTLARRLIEMHKGSLTASSEGAGKGSEFVVRIPLSSGAPSIGGGGQGRVGEHGSVAEKLRVLVVDDNIDAALSMKLYLRAWGYDARTVYDGRPVAGIVQEYHPDVILLDIGLPGMSGYEVAESIRRLPDGDAVTIVAVTGYGQEEDRRRTRAAGIDHHLVKPVDPESLRTILNSVKESRA
jgi:signal transduction histidine kinase/ActR/RegA family two-component response regulator